MRCKRPYEDLQDVDVMNGLAAFLGSDARIEALDQKLKRQNPEPLENKVSNFDQMADALARMDQNPARLTWSLIGCRSLTVALMC